MTSFAAKALSLLGFPTTRDNSGHGLRRTAGSSSAAQPVTRILRVRPLAVRAADRLARLAHGLVGHRAAVDDDPVLVRPAPSRAIVSLSAKLRRQPSVIVSTLIAAPRGRARPRTRGSRAPRIRIGSPGAQLIVRLPPGMSTVTGDCGALRQRSPRPRSRRRRCRRPASRRRRARRSAVSDRSST